MGRHANESKSVNCPNANLLLYSKVWPNETNHKFHNSWTGKNAASNNIPFSLKNI